MTIIRSLTATCLVTIACAAAVLAQSAPQRPPAPSGRRITAHDGDIIVVEHDARVRIVHQREATVRVIFDATERWLVMLADFRTPGGAPDGRVDWAYGYTGVTGEWPLDARWEGAATIEEYTSAGSTRTPQTTAIVTPIGRVHLMGPINDNSLRDPDTISYIGFSGAGGTSVGGLGFDAAERRQVDQTRRQAGIAVSSPSPAIGPSTSLTLEPVVPRVPTTTEPALAAGYTRMPQKIVDVRPVLPPELRNVHGTVVIEITIDAAGAVADARIVRSIAMLDKAALDAVRQWRFDPASIDPAAVPLRSVVTVQFP